MDGKPSSGWLETCPSPEKQIGSGAVGGTVEVLGEESSLPIGYSSSTTVPTPTTHNSVQDVLSHHPRHILPLHHASHSPSHRATPPLPRLASPTGTTTYSPPPAPLPPRRAPPPSFANKTANLFRQGWNTVLDVMTNPGMPSEGSDIDDDDDEEGEDAERVKERERIKALGIGGSKSKAMAASVTPAHLARGKGSQRRKGEVDLEVGVGSRTGKGGKSGLKMRRTQTDRSSSSTKRLSTLPRLQRSKSRPTTRSDRLTATMSNPNTGSGRPNIVERITGREGFNSLTRMRSMRCRHEEGRCRGDHGQEEEEEEEDVEDKVELLAVDNDVWLDLEDDAGIGDKNGIGEKHSGSILKQSEEKMRKVRGGSTPPDAGGKRSKDEVIQLQEFGGRNPDLEAQRHSTDSNGNAFLRRRSSDYILDLPAHPTGTDSSHDSPTPSKTRSRSQSFLSFCGKTVPKAILHFFRPRFEDAGREAKFRKETWYTMRQGALASSFFYIIAFILSWSLAGPTIPEYNRYAFIMANGILSVPLPIFVILNLHRKRPWFYQIWVMLASWEFSWAVLINMWMCGYYRGNADQCINAQSFIALYYWSVALPVIGLLGMGQTRLVHLCGVIVWCGIVIGLVLVPGAPRLMIRNFINLIMIHGFLMMLSYLREKANMRTFALRMQVKLQYKATQKARVAERAASESKKSFVSYIFHEVRVPLNVCLLAIQNLDAEKAWRHMDSDQKDMIGSLKHSLQLMEKVLNDVLSLNRLEAGKLSQVQAPFSFHSMVKLAVMSHRSQARSTGLELSVKMDPAIDKLTVFGDEMRLRQLLGNLINNACKFTPSGSVAVKTKLLMPEASLGSDGASMPPLSPISARAIPTELGESGDATSFQHIRPAALTEQNHFSLPMVPGSELPAIKSGKGVIRVEVTDTGVGISQRDAENSNLFSPYQQTAIGMRQAGKGSGLGLALCQQLVSLFKGRLGVDSRSGKGSTFWFEVPLPVEARKDKAPIGLCAGESACNSASSVGGSRQVSMAGTDTEKLSVNTDAANISSENAGPPSYRTDIATPSVVVAPDPFNDVNLNSASTAVSSGPAQATPTLEHSAAQAKAPPDKLDILVVDDDAITRKLMSKMMTRLGHTVTTAENGAIALELLTARHRRVVAQEQFDIVFLDNQMPVMTGLETVRALRLLGSTVFVVGATGNAMLDDQEDYLRAGADRIMTKPIKLDIIKQMFTQAKERASPSVALLQLGSSLS